MIKNGTLESNNLIVFFPEKAIEDDVVALNLTGFTSIKLNYEIAQNDKDEPIKYFTITIYKDNAHHALIYRTEEDRQHDLTILKKLLTR